MSRRRARQRCTRRSGPATTARPAVGEPGRDGVVDALQDGFLTSAGTSPALAAQPQPDFPRTTASSIACALTASVNCAIFARAASSCRSRCARGRPASAPMPKRRRP